MSGNRISDNKRLAKNAITLYFRMLLTLIVSLYTARVVLQVLGASDYGLYNVVGGIVTIFSIVSDTLATGTQRFLTFSLGSNDNENLKKIFSTTIYIHVFISIAVLLVSEIIGMWLLYNHMQIPDGRMNAAFWVFQFSNLAAVVAIIQVPYMASLIAHEKMDIYAWVTIYDVSMKLLIIYLIQVLDSDKLIMYALMYLIAHLSTAAIYMLYCRRKYDECRMFGLFDKSIFHEIVVFSGWNILGCGAVVLQGQGVNILLNMFFGTIVNAARAIAFQVNSIVLQFVHNFQTAANPQIVKLYASGQIDRMTNLVINTSKMSAYLLLLIGIPLFIEIEFVLNVWLVDYPAYTPIFLRIILIQSFVQSITRPVVVALHAVGKMKALNLTAGSVLLLIMPISYILLKFGASPVTVLCVNVVPWFLELVCELFLLNKYTSFPIWGFYKKVYGVVFPLAIITFTVPYMEYAFWGIDGWSQFFITSIVSVISTSIFIYFCGLPASARQMINTKVRSWFEIIKA